MKITENEPCKVAPTGSVGEWVRKDPRVYNETVRAERSYLRYRASRINEHEPNKVALTGWGRRRSVGEWAFHNPSASNPAVRAERPLTSLHSVYPLRVFLRYRATNPH